MNRSTPGLPVHHQLLEFTQTHVHWVGDAIQPSHPLSSPSPLTFHLSQHQGLLQWVSSSHQVAKVLEKESLEAKNPKKTTHMVDPHYLRIYIGEFAYLLKCIFNLQINQCSHAFMVPYRYAERWKLIPRCACSQLRLNKVTLSLSSCSSSHTISKYLFQGVLKCQNFSFFCAFDWWLYCSK